MSINSEIYFDYVTPIEYVNAAQNLLLIEIQAMSWLKLRQFCHKWQLFEIRRNKKKSNKKTVLPNRSLHCGLFQRWTFSGTLCLPLFSSRFWTKQTHQSRNQFVKVNKIKSVHIFICIVWIGKGMQIVHETILLTIKFHTTKIRISFQLMLPLKFIYSEKATKFCKISTNYLSYVLPVK